MYLGSDEYLCHVPACNRLCSWTAVRVGPLVASDGCLRWLGGDQGVLSAIRSKGLKISLTSLVVLLEWYSCFSGHLPMTSLRWPTAPKDGPAAHSSPTLWDSLTQFSGWWLELLRRRPSLAAARHKVMSLTTWRGQPRPSAGLMVCHSQSGCVWSALSPRKFQPHRRLWHGGARMVTSNVVLFASCIQRNSELGEPRCQCIQL